MKILLILLFGFLSGVTITALFSPSVVSWYFDPPTSIGVSCKEAVVWGINAYQKMVIIGGCVGFFGGIFLAFVMNRKKPELPVSPLTKP